jgi:hypothetical protein
MIIILLRHSKNSRGSFLPLGMPFFVVFDEIANLLVDEKLAVFHALRRVLRLFTELPVWSFAKRRWTSGMTTRGKSFLDEGSSPLF